MQNRLLMNSKNLQSTFPQIYQEFFLKHPLVVSCPRSFTWFGEQAVKYEGLELRQNLPLRTYVGLIPKKKKEVEIASCFSFNPNFQKFQKETFDPYQQEKIKSYLLPFLKKFCNVTNGFQINVLNELPMERGLGAGAFIVALILAAMILENKIDPLEIITWEKVNSLSLCKKSSKFDKLFRILWKWENFLFPGASGANLSSLLPSSTPILFFSKSTVPIKSLVGEKLNLDNLNFIDHNYYQGIRFNEIVPKPIGWPWPFDYGLIFTGETRNVLDSIILIKKINDRLANAAKECRKDFRFFLNFEKEQMPTFYKFCVSRGKIWQEYINTLIVNSLQNYCNFKTIFQKGFSTDLLQELAESLNKEQHLFYLLNLSFQTIENLCSILQKIIRQHGVEDTITAAKISGTIHRGDIVFLVTSHHIRPKIETIINSLKSEFGEEINLDYASWLDGYGKEGVKIEQFWKKNIYSNVIPENSFVLKEYQKGTVSTYLVLAEKIKNENYDLFLDTIKKKIFVLGKPITSKQLPTQAATIEIIALLLERLKPISNKSLPPSSYRSYRNEMQGKIAHPLSKLTQGKVKLVLEGSLLDFLVKLEISPGIKIGLLEKINKSR